MTLQTTDIRSDIAEANKKFMSAFEQGAAGGVAALYSQGGQLLPPGSTTIASREGIEAFWRSAMNMGIKKVQLMTLEVDHHGDTAIEVGGGRLYSDAGDVIDELKYVVVWKEERGQWKIHRDIWNSDKS